MTELILNDAVGQLPHSLPQPDLKLEEALILIVDDTPKNIQLLGSVLKQYGFRVAIAVNGKQTLEFIQKRQPDLILLDVMMPDMDGFTVCEAIKKNPDTAEIPVIFLTAKTENEDKLRGFEVGGADYIAKPFQSEEVIARVNTHLKLKRTTEILRDNAQNLEEMLAERTAQLIQSERHAAFSLLVEGIIHNLKNPLGSISGGAEFIRMSSHKVQEGISKNPEAICDRIRPDLDNILHFSDLVEKGAMRLLEMINSLMAKGRNDKIQSLKKVDLNQLIDEELTFLDADMRVKTCKKTVLLYDEQVPVEVVPSEITQIFQNLVGNAVDAMTGLRERRLTIESGRSGTYAWFSVSDSGPGIPEEIRAKIFDPFFSTKPRAGSASPGKPSGTGLGLYTCLETVKSYGGSIVLESQPGEGARFTVRLPLEKGEDV
ncbi:MAG TPA: hybrid sensor histidine kinase/response regulator [Calditrichia bacterium]|nr:hybrid sensor histidine kinase/response regulator [Calditrichota bacterium]HQV31511.1 hybrid sensor histidine kinase/response regulator [Calditrichia bacterium]